MIEILFQDLDQDPDLVLKVTLEEEIDQEVEV